MMLTDNTLERVLVLVSNSEVLGMAANLVMKVYIYLSISKKESKSSENNSSPEISVDCIQLIVGTFSNVSLDSFLKIEQDYL